MPPFTGLCAFPITPTAPNGATDLDNLGTLLDRIVAGGVDSIGLLGSTGTYAYLTYSERMRVTAFAAERLARTCQFIVSIGAIRTDDAQRLAEQAASVGAAGVLMAPVSYTPLTDDEVFQHYRSVSETTDLPLCIYDNPSTTHFTFSTELLARLAVLPNICGVKTLVTTDMNAHLSSLRGALPTGFQIGYSGDWGCADALANGADAWFSVIAGVLPEVSVKLAHAARSGDRAETIRINDALRPLWALFQSYGSIRVVYAIAHQMQLIQHDLPLPIKLLDKSTQDRVNEALIILNDV
ncbi:dihydrodipicolinate synthase family protein [Yoonia sp. 2307UL14-13]|uniref:dihydrodipicolinate synthase family protein n=1 Tax=Yoonia sp. 2307UL14-13 TaxID=3126506 RepID=UPI0030A175C7